MLRTRFDVASLHGINVSCASVWLFLVFGTGMSGNVLRLGSDSWTNDGWILVPDGRLHSAVHGAWRTFDCGCFAHLCSSAERRTLRFASIR